MLSKDNFLTIEYKAYANVTHFRYEKKIKILLKKGSLKLCNSLILIFISLLLSSCQNDKIISNEKTEKELRSYNYSLNSQENVIFIFNAGNDTLITDKGIFSIKSEMDEKKAYIYHLTYKDKIIGNYFEEFENISKESICLNSFLIGKEECFDLTNISTDSIEKIKLPTAKRKFLTEHKIIR